MLQPQIPGYEIKEEISKGSLATVYRAIHKPLHREVALKVLAINNSDFDQSSQKRFLSEARISANLEHANIINIYDTGRYKDYCYFSMEYLKQGSLRQKLSASGTVTLKESIDIVRQVATALSYTHSRGYIHRDIKPENILFKNQNHIVLTDFGIAKRKNTPSHFTQNRILLGSPQYIAPEQALDQNADNRSDIYSLGVIFYELLTGNTTYKSEYSYLTNLSNLQHSLSNLRSDLKDHQALLKKLLAKNPEDRFQKVDDFLPFLENQFNSTKKTPKTKNLKTHNFNNTTYNTNRNKTIAKLIAILLLVVLIAMPTYISRESFFVNNLITPTVTSHIKQAVDKPKSADTPEPEVSEPEVSEPEVSEPEVSEPEVPEPEVPEPEVPEPEVPEPEVPEPDINCILNLDSCADKNAPSTQPTEAIPQTEPTDTKKSIPPEAVDMACILRLSECKSQNPITTPTKD